MPSNRSEWFKSSYSAQNGDCVEARNRCDGGVDVRDSKEPGGPVLSFSARARCSFLGAVRHGEFADGGRFAG